MRRLVEAYANSRRALARAFATEAAVRQEAFVLLAAVPAAFLLTEEGWRRAALIGAVLFVIAVELLNTAIEKLCDRLHAEEHESIGYVKDLGSAAVLASLAIAGLVWLLALWQWLDRVL